MGWTNAAPESSRTCKELAQALKTELEKEYFYHATVILALDAPAPSRGKVTVSGAVHFPGVQEIPAASG